eukprot:s1194_g13.t1
MRSSGGVLPVISCLSGRPHHTDGSELVICKSKFWLSRSYGEIPLLNKIMDIQCSSTVVCYSRQVVRAVKDVEKKRKLISPQRRIERLFVEEFKKSFFSPNPWYESPELTFPGGNPQKIYNYWMTTRPTRDIERVCDGKDSCGCTWTQLDGRRGASFVSFNQEGQVVFVREVCEPQGLGAKFKDNTLKSLQQVTGVMNAIQGMFSALDRILVQECSADTPDLSWPERAVVLSLSSSKLSCAGNCPKDRGACRPPAEMPCPCLRDRLCA